MDIELSDSSKNLLQQIGFIHSLPLESIAIEEQTEPVSIVLNLKAPSEFSSDDLVEENRISGIEIEVKVTSRNSCESDSGCETDTAFVMLDLIGNSEESEGACHSVWRKWKPIPRFWWRFCSRCNSSFTDLYVHQEALSTPIFRANHDR